MADTTRRSIPTRREQPARTLEQLEGHAWPSPAHDSYLNSTVHRLRKKPIDRFTVEDLRMMIGQGVGLRHLIPRALEVMEWRPLARGDYYPGDLLASVVGTGAWLEERRDLLHRVTAVARRALERLDKNEDNAALRARLLQFLHGRSS